MTRIHVECIQFLERVHQVHQRPPSAIQSPDQDAIDISPSGSLDERLPLRACRGPRPHVLNLDGDGPTPLLGIVPHRQELQGQCLLVVGGDASVEPYAKRPPCPKTPLRSGVETRGVFRGLGMP